MNLCKFAHGHDVAEDVVKRNLAVVFCYVVCTSENHHIFRLMSKYILAEAYKHF